MSLLLGKLLGWFQLGYVHYAYASWLYTSAPPALLNSSERMDLPTLFEHHMLTEGIFDYVWVTLPHIFMLLAVYLTGWSSSKRAGKATLFLGMVMTGCTWALYSNGLPFQPAMDLGYFWLSTLPFWVLFGVQCCICRLYPRHTASRAAFEAARRPFTAAPLRPFTPAFTRVVPAPPPPSFRKGNVSPLPTSTAKYVPSPHPVLFTPSPPHTSYVAPASAHQPLVYRMPPALPAR